MKKQKEYQKQDLGLKLRSEEISGCWALYEYYGTIFATSL